MVLAGTAGLGFRLGLGLGLRCALWRIDENLWFINMVVRFCGIAAVGHAT